MCGILAEGRGFFGVPDGIRPFHGGHPRVSLEVAGCSEAGDVPLEVELVAAGLALGAVYEQSINLHLVSFKERRLRPRSVFNNMLRKIERGRSRRSIKIRIGRTLIRPE